MKILYISHESGLNGSSKSLLEFIARISNKGICPIVIIPSRGKIKLELDKLQINTKVIEYENCVYQNKYSIINYTEYLKKNFNAVRKIVKVIKDEKIDLVHSNSLAVDVGAVAAYVAKIPHVWHFREYLEEDFKLRFINPLIDKWLMRKSACCIAVSNGVKEKSREKYNIRLIRLYNGVDKELYYYPIQKFPNKTGRIRLIIAGGISEGKGQWDAIRAVEILLKKGMDIHLNIVGDGVALYVNSLKKYVKQKNMNQYIAFTSYTKNLQQMRLNSDIILVCSRMEAFGRVTAEAMMAGKIVIGSSSGGTYELIGKHEERGYLYTWNNPEELAGKIEYVIGHSEEVIEKEKKAQNFILKLTDLDVYTDNLKKIYHKVLDSED